MKGGRDADRVRIALANLPFPETAQAALESAEGAVADAAKENARLVAFPECFLPGYRGMGTRVAPPDAEFLRRAWDDVGRAAARANVGVVLGTERVTDKGLLISALVINPDGTFAGFQDKVQLDPSEEATYIAGEGRRLFQVGPLRFGIAICHEGWRYPETVRWAARQGAHVVFHPQFHNAQPGGFVPSRFGDPDNTFHEKAILCRAAENTCYFASINYAGKDSPTTSAIARPDGTLMACAEYGRPGLLVADLDLTQATGLLAKRYKPIA